MPFTIILVPSVEITIDDLQHTNIGKHKKVLKTLGLLQTNPKHPGLHTHEYSAMAGPKGEKVFEAYVENNTPSAFRLFFYYGPGANKITVIAVTPHP